MQSSCYRRCKDCGTTYQWLPETGYLEVHIGDVQYNLSAARDAIIIYIME